MTRWVLLSVLGTGYVVAACGGDDANGHLADAPTSIDAAIDAMDDGGTDPPVPPVTVTVTLGGAAAPNATVYFQNRDSATTVTQLTDSYGDARASIEPGGFVTVIEPQGPPPGLIGGFTKLTTFAAVQPGDHLFVDVPNGGNSNPVLATITIRVPNEAQGYNYHLYTTCGDGDIGRGNGDLRVRAGKRLPAPLTATVENTVQLADCGGTADMLAVGTDGEDVVRSWGYLPAQAVVDQGTVELAAWNSPAARSFSFTLASGGAVDFERTLYTARGALYSASFTVGSEGNTASTTVAMPIPDGVNAVTRTRDFPQTGYGQDHVVDWGANSDYDLDFTAVALYDFTAPPQLDPTTHTLTWSEAVTGKLPDFMTGTYDDRRDDQAQETSHTWTWRIVAPYTAGTLAYPVLPTTLFDFNPKAGDTIDGVSIRSVQVPGGYRAARTSKIFSGEDPVNLDVGIAGASGRIVFETVRFQEAITSGVVTPHRAVPARKNPATLRRGRFTRHAR